jgi:selenocysteine lyase/cysteine desulfurase
VSNVWTEVRREFPALERHVYLNAAAASPTPRCVRAAVERFHRELEEDGDAHWEAWLDRREAARTSAARLVGAHPDEIAFAPNTSAGINAIADLLEEDGGVLTDSLEFPTVTLPWIHRGMRVDFVEPRSDGVLAADTFAEGVAPRAATMVLSHVQFSNGCRQDLETFGGVKGSRRFVVCASQSAGAFPIDVGAARIDALATAGHKWLCAGYGAGFFYVSRALLARRPRSMGWMSVEDPFAFNNRSYRLLTSARRYELGCPWLGPIFALGAAVEFLLAIGIEAVAGRVLELNSYLTDQLHAAGIDVLSPGGPHRSGETLCRVPDPSRAVAALRERHVHVTEKPEGIRIATHCYNDEADIDTAVAAIRSYVSPVADR